MRQQRRSENCAAKRKRQWREERRREGKSLIKIQMGRERERKGRRNRNRKIKEGESEEYTWEKKAKSKEDTFVTTGRKEEISRIEEGVKVGLRKSGREREVQQGDREGATVWQFVGENRDTLRAAREKDRPRGDRKSKRNSQLRLDRMRVLGCGVSSPPDKRQEFSSVDGYRNTTIRSNAGEAGVGNIRDSSARTLIESAESFARGASSVKDEGKRPEGEEDRKRFLRGSKDRCHRDTAALGEYARTTCFILGKSRKRSSNDILANAASGAVLGTRSLASGRCDRRPNWEPRSNPRNNKNRRRTWALKRAKSCLAGRRARRRAASSGIERRQTSGSWPAGSSLALRLRPDYSCSSQTLWEAAWWNRMSRLTCKLLPSDRCLSLHFPSFSPSFLCLPVSR